MKHQSLHGIGKIVRSLNGITRRDQLRAIPDMEIDHNDIQRIIDQEVVTEEELREISTRFMGNEESVRKFCEVLSGGPWRTIEEYSLEIPPYTVTVGKNDIAFGTSTYIARCEYATSEYFITYDYLCLADNWCGIDYEMEYTMGFKRIYEPGKPHDYQSRVRYNKELIIGPQRPLDRYRYDRLRDVEPWWARFVVSTRTGLAHDPCPEFAEVIQ